VQALEAVWTSRPVELTPEQRAALRDAIAAWAGEAGGEGLPEGIAELRVALIDGGLSRYGPRPAPSRPDARTLRALAARVRTRGDAPLVRAACSAW
jgi:hypothetical protein